jgi:DNA primase
MSPINYFENKYDIISFLEDNEISFQKSGKNVTTGWIEIQCPYEGCFDPSTHCGINLKSGLHHCWICGSKGGMEKLASKILGISYQKALDILSKYPANPSLLYEEESKTRDSLEEISLEGFETELANIHRNYLENRGFNPKVLQKDYQLRCCYQTGKYPYRIIIPIIVKGKVVNLTARDVTGQQSPKYKNLSNQEAVIPMKECLYNIDSVDDKVVIVEGVLDVWRIGPGSVATMGTEYTSKQLSLLFHKKIKKVFVLYDSDAIKKAEKLSYALSTFVPRVEVLSLEEGDPADMKIEEVNQLRKEIGL